MNELDTNKKCCINCAFCAKNKSWDFKYPFTQPREKTEQFNKEERKQLKTQDYDLKKNCEEEYKNWLKELNKRKESKKDPQNQAESKCSESKFKPITLKNAKNPSENNCSTLQNISKILSPVQEMLLNVNNKTESILHPKIKKTSEAEELGMPEEPDIPDEVKPICYKYQWSDKERESRDKEKKIPDRCCEFYFSFEGCEGLIMEVIEKKQIRQMELENAITAKNALKISNLSMWFSVIAIVISIASMIVGLYISQRSDNKSEAFNIDWQTKQVDAIKSIPNQNYSKEFNKIDANLKLISKTLNKSLKLKEEKLDMESK